MNRIPPATSFFTPDDVMQQLLQTTSTSTHETTTRVPFTDIVNLVDLNCFFTHTMINEPGALICGHSFEEAEIQKWYDVRKGSVCCPLCKHESPAIGKNLFLKNLLDRWKLLSLSTVENRRKMAM
jgi:hypothetical protein